MTGAGMFRARRRPRRWLAEIVTGDGRLLRRERFTTATVDEAAEVWRKMIAPHFRDPLARRVEFYRTATEPDAPPELIMPIYTC